MSRLRTVRATRYVTPLREGGSLPAIVEADDDGLYVLKFRGAGQGARALVAELVAGELGRVLGLPVPELVFVELDPVLGRSEPDPEIQALLEASGGLNLGVGYLPGALPFNPLLAPPPEPVLAAAIVWFDAYVTNVDRTARNTNLLLWGRRLWLIDHGAALYFHHRWEDYLARSQSRFPQIKEHVLLPLAGELAVADATASRQLTAERLAELVALIPDDWLAEVPGIGDAAAQRLAYRRYLEARLAGRQGFVEEAAHARAQLI